MTNETIEFKVEPETEEAIRFAHGLYPSKEIEASCKAKGLTGKDLIVPGTKKTLLEYFGPEWYYPKTIYDPN